MLRRLLLVIFIFSSVLCQRTANAYASDIRFSHITSENGLMQSHITCILQDRRGLIWFGTRNGLCRYNGYDFQTFTHKIDNSNSLPDNFIRSIFQDNKGNIWIGTDKGICMYLPLINGFISYPGISGQVSSITQTPDSRIYCASATLYCFDKRTNSMKPVTLSDRKTTIRGAQVLAIDKNGRLWVGGKRGLHCFNNNFSSHKEIHVEKKDGNKYVISVFIDKNNNVWAGKNGGGLIHYNQHTNAMRFIDQSDGLANNVVRVFAQDIYGRIWCGTEKGISIIYSNGKIENERQEYSDNFTLSDNAIYSILSDKHGNVWVGTYFGGANLYVNNSEQIRYYNAGSKPTQLKGKAVRQMAEENRDILWIATEDGGLNRLDRSNGIITKFSNNNVVSDNIHSLQIDHDNNLWIGSFMGGLTRYNLNTHVSQIYNNTNSAIPDNSIFSLYADRDNDLWIGTTGGLCFRNHKTGLINIVNVKDLGNLFIFNITGDKYGNIWIGTRYNGLKCYNKYSGILRSYSARPGRHDITDDYITVVYADSRQRIWVGTNNGGLFLYNHKSDDFTSFMTEGILNESCIYGITEDNNHDIWISAGKNLYCYNTHRHNVTCLSKSDNIPINHYNYVSALKDHEGRLYFGSVNGLTSFIPKQVLSRPLFPSIQLTGLTNSNNESHYIDYSKKVELSYDEGELIGIQYAAINPDRTLNIVYAVRMKGVNNQWQYVNSQQKIFYSHLSPGTYEFQVRATSVPGVWNDSNIRTIEITIKSPFYATVWAYLIYLILLSVLGYWIWHFYNIRMHERRMAYENLVEKNKLKKLNELKQDFLTDISHEFKTPLALIIAPVRQILEGKKELSGRMKENLEMILKGANTLKSLIQELVEVNNMKSKGYDLSMGKGNPLSLINNIAKRFCPLADNKGIAFNIEIEDWEEDVIFSPIAVEKIVNNLLSNAFKFTETDGTVEISASLVNSSADNRRYLQIVVNDNGRGIPEEDIEKIFQKFYQVSINGMKSPGWGIGLPMVKNLVEAHKGTISVESQFGKGSMFTVMLNVTDGLFTVTEENNKRLNKEEMLLLSGATAIDSIDTDDEPQDSADGERNEILIVEDNTDMLKYLKNLFSDDYNVRTSTNGKDALQLLEGSKLPDIVISDVMMPVMSGTELCRTIKSDILTAHIPVILLTAKTGMDNAIKGYELGADIYMEKPFNPSMLQLQVHNMLKTRDNNRRQFKESASIDIDIMANNKYDKKLLQDIQHVVELNIANSEFCVNDIVKEVGISRTKLHVKLKSLINMSIGEYIKEMRIRKAKELMMQGMPITETTYATGFSDPNYFAKCFKKNTGMLPRDFIKSIQEKAQEESN